MSRKRRKRPSFSATSSLGNSETNDADADDDDDQMGVGMGPLYPLVVTGLIHHIGGSRDANDESLFETDSEEDEDEPIKLYPIVYSLHQLILSAYSEFNLATACRPTLPPKAADRPLNTLILDLDETLVHCALEPLSNADFAFPIAGALIYVRLRPGLHKFLETVSSMFEVVIFTASQPAYASPLVDIIEQNYDYPLIHHRLYRDSCLQVHNHFVKELSVVNRPLSNLLIVDNNPVAFAANIENGVHIKTWKKDPSDTELLDLIPFLQEIHSASDLRPHLEQKYSLRDRIESVAK